jgi:hypothetical protein
MSEIGGGRLLDREECAGDVSVRRRIKPSDRTTVLAEGPETRLSRRDGEMDHGEGKGSCVDREGEKCLGVQGYGEDDRVCS